MFMFWKNKMLLRESLKYFYFCAQMHPLLIYGMFILYKDVKLLQLG